MLKRTIMASAVLVALVLPVTRAEAAAPPTTAGGYCVVHVTGHTTSGELQVSAPACYDTFAKSMSAEHVGAWGDGASAKAQALSVTTFTLGTHCDGYNLAAPCTSVVGDSCTGGWLNTSAAWNNRISSTSNGCPTIGHFDLANLGGASVSTVGAGAHNLTTFNNRTTSLQYS